MSNKLYDEKLAQAASYLQEQSIDAWLIFSSEGSDPCLPLMTGIRTVGKTFFIVTKENKRYALASVIDAQESEQSGLFDKVLTYKNADGSPENELFALLKEINPSRIAINVSKDDNLCDGLTAGRYRFLKSAAGQYAAGFISSESFLKRLRSIKTAKEIEYIKKAIEITEEIYAEVFKKTRAGMTEYQVGELFIEAMKSRGVVNGITRKLTMPIIMKERIAHREPGDAVLNGGDFVIFDFSVDYNGYTSDIARTAYVLKEGQTEAPEEFKERFKAAYDAITLVAEGIRPGIQGFEADSIAREHYKKLGLPDITHSTGHQIGRECHDGGTLLGPKWERYSDAPYGIIEENNVFTIEPTILFFEGGYSVLTEENILVTNKGVEFLSNRQKEIILIK